MNTHVYTVEHGIDSLHIAGIRFPTFGQGVASLVNARTDVLAKACLEPKKRKRVNWIPTVKLVTSRTVEAGEEILVDYHTSD